MTLSTKIEQATAPSREKRLTPAAKDALKWMREHGGDAAVVRVKGGGRYVLAQGETGPFTFATCKRLIDAGLAEYVDENGRKAVRFRLTKQGTQQHD